MCRPLADTENSCRTREKTSGTQVGKRSPRLKILEIPGGRGAIKNPLEQKILGVGGANQRVFHGGGIDILISGTTH